jgi:C4-dicarboxylate-specific signal transduction histidine kinase
VRQGERTVLAVRREWSRPGYLTTASSADLTAIGPVTRAGSSPGLGVWSPWRGCATRRARGGGPSTRRALVRKDEPRRELADVDQIVTAALAIVAPSARERGSDVRFHRDGDLPAVEVDRIQIEQVVLNLVLNALDAVEVTMGKREVEVRATACGGHAVEVAVCDSGPGLDPALLERIFEPFYTTKENGLGMGLAISRAIVDAHDGRLSAAADPGGGAIFRLVLPAARGR